MSQERKLAFEVLGQKFLVEPTELNNTTEGGIIIPEQIASKSRLITGTVLTIGDNVEKVKPGDVILYERFLAQEIELKDQNKPDDDAKAYHIITNELQIHGIFRN